ncbi:AMP-binding protein [Noviherbaspirillum galbum]|uniref:Long-chain fatty acid--CoA ligase n=1 Tax=Noviherbaspirillum galbum TaxID=2709383 RepID=A0A6B3SVQ6_9BURK|nr:AMP-binding protein [Noviherbaspirillum galbum]NEX62986.1 long-chain fatty acid--CoA ligase [Noviherbaspirillum galbum]
MDICRHIRRGARYWPQQPAVVCGARSVTFAQLDERSNRLANALIELGLRKGDRVALQARNCTQLVELETALLKAGLVKAALNARFTPAEAMDVVSNAAPKAFVAGPGFTHYRKGMQGLESVGHFISMDGTGEGMLDYEGLIAAAPASAVNVAVSADDLAVLHFSSGSTGKIKAAMQTFGNRMACIRKVLFRNEGAPRPGDRIALLGPVTHASGMLMQPFLYAGATLHLFERFDPAEFLAAVEQFRITHSFMVPAMINALLQDPTLGKRDLSSLRQLTYGAAPMAPARIREAWDRIGPVLAQGYGLSESTSAICTLTTRDHAEALRNAPDRLASCGRSYGESEVRVVDARGEDVRGDDIGEIVVRGDDVFKGYWGEPGLSAEVLVDGWLRTGDLARMDEHGFIYIVDRMKDMVVSGGFNVYPTEVEAALYQHPAVYEACVIGVPDERWGEAVKALVVPRPGAEAREPDLISHCRTLLADYKAPRSIDFVAALPKNANGKMARKEVRQPYWAGQERMVN